MALAMKTTITEDRSRGPVFDVSDERTFRENFNNTSFGVEHRLADHPLFAFDRLFELVRKKKAKGELYWDMGDIRINQKWNEVPAPSLSIEEAFNRIENANAWLILRSVHTEPDYRAILDASMAEVERLSGVDFRRYVKLKDSIIFITSPRRITTYHMDRECSMLLQIRGNKAVSVFDPKDRDVLTEEEIERFWAVDNNAASYKERYQNRATTYHLKPGQAVHIPVNAPHWVENGEGVSISMNINFHFHDFVRADLYRVNYALRRLGLSPTPPGTSRVRDAVKRLAIGKPISVVNAIRRHTRKK